MEMQQLHHFLAVARLGSIGRAAEELNLSQPGLSRSIRALESILGLPLFERESRGVRLTDFGESLVTRAEIICNEHERAMVEARAIRALKSGDVTIGFHAVFAQIGGADAIDRFMTAYPTISLGITTGALPSLASRVANSELDLAFTLFDPVSREAGLVYEDLFELSCSIYHRSEGAADIAGTSSLADLVDRPWALGGGAEFRLIFEAAFRSAGLAPPRRFVQASSLRLLLDLVLRRDLLTIVPDQIAETEPYVGRLRRVDVPAPGGRPHGGLIYREDIMKMPPVRAIAAQLRATALLFARPGRSRLTPPAAADA